jgi:hypothetical protein
MLSQIGGAIGSMGSTYTEDLKRNIQNVTRPQVKPDDDMSMMNMADWAAKMGRTDEAKMYQKQAEHISTAHTKQQLADQDQNFTQGLFGSMEGIRAAEAAGDVDKVQRLRADMESYGKRAATSEQGRMYQAAIKDTDGVIGRTKANQTQGTVQKIMESDNTFANLPEEVRNQPEAAAAIQRQKVWRQQQLLKPEVSKAYNEVLDQKLSVEAKQETSAHQGRERQADSVRSVFTNTLGTNSLDPKNLEKAMDKARDLATTLGTEEATAALKDVEHLYKGYETVSKNAMTADTMGTAYTALETQVNTLTARLGDGHAKPYTDALAEIKTLTEKSGNMAYVGEAKKKMDKLAGQIFQETLQMNSDERTAKFNADVSAQKKRERIITGSILPSDLDAMWGRMEDEDSWWQSSWEDLGPEGQNNVARDYALVNAGQEPHFYKWADGRVIKGKNGKPVPQDARNEVFTATPRGTEETTGGRSVGGRGVAGKVSQASQEPEYSTDGQTKVGAIEDGYRFIGGDANDPNSWEEVK